MTEASTQDILVRHVTARTFAGNDEPVIYVIVQGADACNEFKKLVQQGSCLEPNLSPAMKELADLVTVGSIQQPYRSMPK